MTFSELFNDTKHRAVSLRQLRFLSCLGKRLTDVLPLNVVESFSYKSATH